MKALIALCLTLWGTTLVALELNAPFENIDGGTLAISEWAGQPVLIVNTASRCGYAPQFTDLQKLYDTYREQGLVVLTVPSDDFRQELATNEEVKDYCELQYGIDLPMTGITHVKGSRAHPFYQSLREEAGFTPRWNFNKVLLAPDGTLVKTYSAKVKPMSRSIRDEIEGLLN